MKQFKKHTATCRFKGKFPRYEMPVTQINSAELTYRFLLSSLHATVLCLLLGALFLHTTGVPLSYPPLLPMQLIAGAVGGALLCTLGFSALRVFVRDNKMFSIVFMALGILLLIASFHLPYRLSYTTSPRFAGVTIAAQFAQAVLHCVVVGVSIRFLLRPFARVK
jgi:tryptophan-rich sensory protein